MPSADETPSSPTRKYTRYRRRTADAEPAPPQSPVVEVKAKDESIARSMSRYRRSRVVPKTDHAEIEPIPEVPQMPRELPSQTMKENKRPIDLRDQPARRNTDPLERSGNEGAQKPPRETEAERARRKAQSVPEEEDRRELERAAQSHQPADRETAKPRAAEIDAERRRKARKILEEQERRETEEDARQDARKHQMAEEEANRRLAEQKKKDLERLEAVLDAAPPVQQVSSPSRLRFWRKGTKPTPPTSPKHAVSAGLSTAKAQTRAGGSKGIEETIRSTPQRYDEPRKVEPPPKSTNAIVQGGGGIVPQTDAPISASNAGERRVLIRCNQASINLPVTPETTPVELISSAANTMSQPISISTAIIIESYTQVGLERKVRRYEHVRDILNSWDRDTQNSLTIENSQSPDSDFDLEVAHASKYTPADFTVYMYHSQKPGKWNKRYITLLASGQMFISKKQDAKSADKDVVNICHLSDFDIYTPTSQQSKKVLKPPKKHCYAIKSQQKPAMFLSTENFVHFFCTDDRKLSWRFYETIQQWRSWYLVTRMGEGAEKAAKTTSSAPLGRTLSKGGQSSRGSANDNPYTIGSFQPLMASDRFASQDQKDADDETPLHIPFHLRNGSGPPQKRNSNKYPPAVNYKVPGEALDEFSTDGLLGRSYSQRQHQLKEGNNDGPFTDGPSLLNGPKSTLHHRSLSVKSTRRPETSGSGLGRSGSQRQKPKPLLDFTPTFKEAPQWNKTGKGHGVKALNGVPLVDVATGPESAVPGLPGTLFRREPLGGPLRPSTSRSSKEREGAFIKGGLVSSM